MGQSIEVYPEELKSYMFINDLKHDAHWRASG